MTRKYPQISFRVSDKQLEEANKLTTELRDELNSEASLGRLPWKDADVHRLALMTGLRALRSAR